MEPMEDKDFGEFKPYFKEGVHEVYITGGKAGKSANSGSSFVEFDIVGENGEEGNVRLYVTENSAKYTRRTLAGIAVHNKEKEEDKNKVKEFFKNLVDSDEMTKQPFLDKFKDNQAWIKVSQDLNSPKPNGGFYLRTSLYSYKPKDDTADLTSITDGSKPVNLEDIPF